jgi:hypothetical protein
MTGTTALDAVELGINSKQTSIVRSIGDAYN